MYKKIKIRAKITKFEQNRIATPPSNAKIFLTGTAVVIGTLVFGKLVKNRMFRHTIFSDGQTETFVNRKKLSLKISIFSNKGFHFRSVSIS